MSNINPEKIAYDLLSRYKFSDAEEAYNGNMEDVTEEVRRDVVECLEILICNEFDDEAICKAVDEFFELNPVGTDLDKQYGVGTAGFVDHVQKRLLDDRLKAFKSIGPNASEFFSKIDGGLSNVESTHLSAIIDVLNIFAESGLSNDEVDAVCKHVSERSLPISYMELGDFFPFLEEAIKVTKEGGIKALRKFEKEVLLWD